MTILTLSFVSLLVLVVAVLNWRASREVEARLAPLREAEKPTSISDLKPLPVADSDNAAKAIEPLEELCRELDSQLAKAIYQKDTDEEYEAALIGLARTIATDHPELIPSLKKAFALPEFQPDYEFDLSPTAFMDNVLQQNRSVRMVARVMHGHGLMSLEDGETDEAIADALSVLKWSGHIANQPLLVNYLVSAAVRSQALDLASRCLVADNSSPQMRTQLIDALERSDLQKQFDQSIESERAFGISSFESFALFRFQVMVGELSAYLDMVDEFKLIVQRPTGVAPKQPETSSMFAASTWPAFETGLAALRRSQAKSQAILILAAWQDQGSDVTTKVADLRLPASITLDPFDGSQMKLKATKDTVVVYSVGQNLTDDGGKLAGELDVGVGR
ncbi:hypothetical protein [Rubripirellula obstinata]|nr:hypothetical protein [Rubripirellula obstinata]